MGKNSLFFLASLAVASTGIYAANTEFRKVAANPKAEGSTGGTFNLDALNSQQLPESIVLPKGHVGAVFGLKETQSKGNS
jgi:hypothetical protein